MTTYIPAIIVNGKARAKRETVSSPRFGEVRSTKRSRG